MSATATEQSILKVVAELGQATKSRIQEQLGLSPGYTEYLCRYLVRSGYLKFLGQGRYALAAGGKKILISLGWGLEFDKASVKELASQVAKEVSRAIKIKGIRREIVREKIKHRQPEEERRKIEIKTDYFLPVGDETAGLETNIEKVGAQIEKEGSKPLDTSVQLLKNLKKSKAKNYEEKITRK